jgi:hypothetical protein
LNKKELSELYFLNREIEQQQMRLQELEAIAEGTTARITGMPFGKGDVDKIGNYVSEIADLKGILNVERQILVRSNCKIFSGLSIGKTTQ